MKTRMFQFASTECTTENLKKLFPGISKNDLIENRVPMNLVLLFLYKSSINANDLSPFRQSTIIPCLIRAMIPSIVRLFLGVPFAGENLAVIIFFSLLFF